MVSEGSKGEKRKETLGMAWMVRFLSIYLKDFFLLKNNHTSLKFTWSFSICIDASGFIFSYASLEKQLLLWSLIHLASKGPQEPSSDCPRENQSLSRVKEFLGKLCRLTLLKWGNSCKPNSVPWRTPSFLWTHVLFWPEQPAPRSMDHGSSGPLLLSTGNSQPTKCCFALSPTSEDEARVEIV